MASTTTGALLPVDRFFEFSLLGLLTAGYLAVVGSGYLDPPTIAVTAAALLFRALLVSGVISCHVPARLVAALTIAYMGFYPLDYLFLSKSFVPATVHLIFFIAVVKITTAVTNRDFFFVKVIAFLELLAACVVSSSVNFFLFLALFLLLGVATLMSSEIRRAGRQATPVRVPTRGVAWRLSGFVASVSVGILVITALLFFLLPRTARAALQHLFQHRYHLAGFSNEVSLGDIGEIKKQDTPILHVKMDPAAAAPSNLRWRGSALSQFDGHRWFNPPGRGEPLYPDSVGQLWLGSQRHRKGLSYAVHLNEAAPDGVLFFAGSPQSLRVEANLVIHTTVDSYRLVGGAYPGLNYQVFSYLEPSSAEPEGLTNDPAPPDLTLAERDRYMQLPPLDARIWTLARRIPAPGSSPEAKSRAIEQYLRGNFGYTLQLPDTEPADPLGNFLFSRRKGHCEYFASAMAVMLRTLGIPSRVVTGFAGGVYNPISGWQVIRASDAHSWVEAYLPRIGWTTFDPTPPDPNPPQLSLFSRFGFYVDAAEVFWQDWVLNYNFDRQLQIASRMEQSSRDFRTNWFEDYSMRVTSAAHASSAYAPAGIALVVFGILLVRFGGGFRAWWIARLRFRRLRRGEVSPSDATLLYGRMLKSLKRRGIEKPQWLTPCEFARAVKEPGLAPLVGNITNAYNDLRFGGRTEAANSMVRLLSQLEALPK